MEKDKEITRVIFRKWSNGDIIALFPDDPYYPTMIGKDEIMSYEHIGQHGCATYPYVISTTKLATPEEYIDLLAELQSIGYNLKVCKRR